MAAKKKTPSKKSNVGSSNAAEKRVMNKKSKTDGRKNTRTSKSGLSGMGMTESAVEQRATDASVRSKINNAVGGSLEWSFYRNTGLYKGVGLVGGSFRKGTDRTALSAANAVRKKYGVKPKKK
jgi:hypothetical protein